MVLRQCEALVSALPWGRLLRSCFGYKSRAFAPEAASSREHLLSTGNQFESACSRPEFVSRASAGRRAIVESACSRNDLGSRAVALDSMSLRERKFPKLCRMEHAQCGAPALSSEPPAPLPPRHDGLLP